MAYEVPSTNVYQQLSSAGGLIATTPDLPACILGPVYNVVDYSVNPNTALAGTVSDTTVANTFTLPAQIAGQQPDVPSIDVTYGHVQVESLSGASFTANPSDNVLTYTPSGAATLNGKNNAGTNLVAPGNTVVVTYGSTPTTFTTTVLAVTSNTTMTVADILPSSVTANEAVTVSVYQNYNHISANTADIDTTNATTNGTITVGVTPSTPYGTLTSASIYISYRALRQDLTDLIDVIDDNEIRGKLGEITPRNPAAFAASVSVAGSGAAGLVVNVMPVTSNDLTGYTQALSKIENHRVYGLVPLTQDIGILDEVKTHCDTLSEPTKNSWRIAFVNTPRPTTKYIGPYSSSNTGTIDITANPNGTGFVITDSSGTFISDGVAPNDTLVITSATTASNQGDWVVQSVFSNQTLLVSGSLTPETGASYYIERHLSESEQAADIAAQSGAFNDKRIYHVFPDQVQINHQMVPGYYACAVISGMVSAYEPQQGFTNMTVPVIEDLYYSNFYFGRNDLNTMAASGTWILVQDSQGGSPYVRHELSTDVSMLNTQELMRVRNLDYLSYQYHDIMNRFIGTYNITTNTLNSMRQEINAQSGLFESAKSPKIGPVLLSHNIKTLEQNPNNMDRVTLRMTVSTVYPDNYNDIYLVV